MNALMSSAAILTRVPQPKEDAPAWQRRIADAVKPHGKLKELADAAEMPSSQLQRMSNGVNKNPGIQTLQRVATAMGMTVEELISAPRPEESGHAQKRGRNPVLEERFASILEAFDVEVPAEDTWRGDVLKAIAALNRALRRPDTGTTATDPQRARR